jgi:starvation-inducible DNA-binding protein
MSGKKNHNVGGTLAKLLADSYLLGLKTQNYHWNVTGMSFGSLHALFETQYNDIAAAVDELAERIRALGEKAPGSFAAFSKLSSIKEETGNPGAEQMIKKLVADHETLAETCEAVIEAADEIDDEGTEDMAIARLKFHQKAVWMLKAHLQ